MRKAPTTARSGTERNGMVEGNGDHFGTGEVFERISGVDRASGGKEGRKEKRKEGSGIRDPR